VDFERRYAKSRNIFDAADELLLTSGSFTGDPGLDRVIFSTPDCFLAGELTMQGQGAGRYTECSEEY
jgi:hypothetical protein